MEFIIIIFGLKSLWLSGIGGQALRTPTSGNARISLSLSGRDSSERKEKKVNERTGSQGKSGHCCCTDE